MRHTADSGPLLSLLGASWTDRASVTISRPKRGNPFLGPRRPSRMPGTGPFLWLMKHAPPSGFLSVKDGPRRNALRHLVLRRRDAAEGISDPRPAVVHRTIVAGSAVRADDRVCAGSRRRRRAVAGGENPRGTYRGPCRRPLGFNAPEFDSAGSRKS